MCGHKTRAVINRQQLIVAVVRCIVLNYIVVKLCYSNRVMLDSINTQNDYDDARGRGGSVTRTSIDSQKAFDCIQYITRLQGRIPILVFASQPACRLVAANGLSCSGILEIEFVFQKSRMECKSIQTLL